MSAPVREVVLLHGWSSSPAVWRDLRERLAPLRTSAPDLSTLQAEAGSDFTVGNAAARLARAAPARCDVVGWSLGGLLALAWANRAPQQIARLVLMAATPSFLARRGWPEGMAPATFATFEQGLATQPAAALRRFAALQAQGDVRSSAVARALRAAQASPEAALAVGLGWLRDTDLRESLRSVRAPALVIHGRGDRVVSEAAAARMSRMLSAARYLCIETAGHAPFLSDPRAVAAALRRHFDD